MKALFTTTVLRLLWVAALLLFVADWLLPVSNRLTRSAGIGLLAVVWIGLIALGRRHRLFRTGLLFVSACCTIFLMLPARHPDPALLRSAYVAGLRRYMGVPYSWGGESPKGIDCSGLIRRGIIDSLFLRGLETFDPGLVRQSVWIWWHDCSAQDFGEGKGFTERLFQTPGINNLDHSRIIPGDLAVTKNGIHILAYIGDNTWIEADPGVARVITVTAPSKDNVWFQGPMNIVRWKILK